MNKLIKILLVTVLFSLLPVANLFALSKEATEVIEAMRMRLNQQGAQINQETLNQSSSDDEYVPGKELAEVLARIRRNRYAHHSSNVANSTDSHITNISIKPIKDSKEEEKVVVSEPEEQIDQNSSNEQPTIIEATTVPETTPLVAEDQDEIESSNTEKQSSSNPDELVIIEAMEADDSEAYSIPIDNSKAKIETAPTTNKKSDEYVPGQLLEQSVKRIRHSRRRNTPASYEIDSAIENYEKRLAEKNNKDSQQVMSKASEEIEELFNNPEKRSQIAEEGRERYNSQKMNSEVDNDKIDDERFNDYISKYDFKMPENYRIIVE